MIWDTSIWRPGCSNPSKIRSAQKCYLCLRYEVLPMCPGRTLLKMVGLGGFEPPTRSLGNCCSIHLSYSPADCSLAWPYCLFSSAFGQRGSRSSGLAGGDVRFAAHPDLTGFRILLPAAQFERCIEARSTQLVGVGAVHQGPGYNHSSNAQSGDGLRFLAGMALVRGKTSFKHTDHGPEHGFEGLFRRRIAASYIGGKGNHRARVLDILKMLARQIGADDLHAHIR